MCDNRDINDHCQYGRYADVYCRSTDLFRSDTGTVANYFYQWYYWKLVTGTQQYRYYNLHLYAGCGSVCDNNDLNDHCWLKHHTDVYRSSTDLFRSNADSITYNF